jgi:hypothetical protein
MKPWDDVHGDPYPSEVAMETAVAMEVMACLGRVQTQTIGKMIQRAIDETILRNAEAS